MKSILIIEDDIALRMEIKEILEEHNYIVFEAGNGKDALAAVKLNKIDLCLLDVGLPDCLGTDLCRQIREFSFVPIIFITGCDDEEQIVKAFDLGADDYVTKPFKLSILISRILAQLRREDWYSDDKDNFCYCSGELFIYPSLRQIKKNHEILPIRPIEYAIFEVLFNNHGHIVSRNKMLQAFWDDKNNFVEENTLNVNISRLRKQLGTYNGKAYIETAKFQGYFWAINVTKI